MNTTKYLLFTALGVAAVLLLTSDRAKELRDEAEDNAKKWAVKFKRISNGTGDTLAELKNLLSNEIEGLSDDARERIENIINGTTKSVKKAGKNLNSQLS